MGLEGGARRGEVLVDVDGRRGGTRRRRRRAWKGPGTIDVYVNINTNTCHLIVISHIIGILPSRSSPLPLPPTSVR